VGIFPFRDVLVGEEALLGQGIGEFLQHLARVDHLFEPGALDVRAATSPMLWQPSAGELLENMCLVKVYL
jgi:hypothetical protein